LLVVISNIDFFQSLVLHEADDVDAEAEEVLNELNLLTQSEGGGDISQPDSKVWGIYYNFISNCNVYTYHTKMCH
jgi:hypothetical protein